MLRGIIIAVVILAIVMLGTAWSGRATRSEWIAAMVLCVPVLILLAQYRRLERELVERTERRMGPYPPVCIVCAYDLSASRVANDGCTVCPECGAAWRLDSAGAGR